MKAGRFRIGEEIRIGLVEAESVRLLPPSSGDLVETLAERGWHAFEGAAATAIMPLTEVRVLCPLPKPPKILCVGMNYRGHAAEQGIPPPDHPVFFAKWPSAVIGPDEPIILHPVTSKVDYEAEFAVVIRGPVRDLRMEDAMGAVLGYTALNDVSARDLQFADGQFTRSKSLDSFAPIGPFIVSPDHLNPANVRVRCRVNGEVRQESVTADLIFSVADLLSFVSQGLSLETGDVMSTGTPAGVGIFMSPPRFLSPGDVVEVEVEGIGRLRNHVRALGLGGPTVRG